MGKGANKALMGNANVGAARSGKINEDTKHLYGTLDPMLEAEATNPQGYSTEDMSAMNTASQQSLGGSTAGITGQANLTAARTRNAGGFSGAIGSGSRQAQRDLSQNAVEIQGNNARLKEAQKQQAIQQLMELYGIDQQTALGYMNSSTGSLNAENQSHPIQSGFSVGAQWINALANAGKAASGGEGEGG